jgi:acyl transferase domain-containing protein
MENGLIPPNIYFSKPNPAIPLDEWNMAVPTKLTPWPVSQTGRRMSVSGFGMGGTNGHVVLEAFNAGHKKFINGALPNGHANGITNGATTGRANDALTKSSAQNARHDGKRLFVLSSQDQAGFKRLGSALVKHLDSVGPAASTVDYLANLSHTLSTARSGLTWRSGFLAENTAELREKLSTESGENATRAANSKPRIG